MELAEDTLEKAQRVKAAPGRREKEASKQAREGETARMDWSMRISARKLEEGGKEMARREKTKSMEASMGKGWRALPRLERLREW